MNFVMIAILTKKKGAFAPLFARSAITQLGEPTRCLASLHREQVHLASPH